MSLLMATLTPPDGDPEAEPVQVVTWPDALEFVLDDGTRLVFDRSELAHAIAPASSERSAA